MKMLEKIKVVHQIQALEKTKVKENFVTRIDPRKLNGPPRWIS